MVLLSAGENVPIHDPGDTLSLTKDPSAFQARSVLVSRVLNVLSFPYGCVQGNLTAAEDRRSDYGDRREGDRNLR